MSDKVILVGESNPYGGDDYYALYPHPDGSARVSGAGLLVGEEQPTTRQTSIQAHRFMFTFRHFLAARVAAAFRPAARRLRVSAAFAPA